MLVVMLCDKNLYFKGEVVELDDAEARDFIKKGYAVPVGCPDCGAPLVHESGCRTCYNCGWSNCG